MPTVPGTGTGDQHNSRVCAREHVADGHAILTVPDEAEGKDRGRPEHSRARPPQLLRVKSCMAASETSPGTLAPAGDRESGLRP